MVALPFCNYIASTPFFTTDDGEQETIDIGGWDRDAIKEYLAERLAK